MPVGNDIKYAAQLLQNGEVVAIPTETVYGLAGNAFNKIAVAKIFEIKNRPAFNPLIVHIKNVGYAHTIAKQMDDRLMKLFEKFSPGPISILVDKKDIIPGIVTAGSYKVAIRVPAHPLTLELLQLLDFPLAAPSANPFQYISPTTAKQVQEQLGNKIPYLLEGGKCRVGIESTIVGIENSQVVIYRLGGLEVEKIQQTVGNVIVKSVYSNDSNVQTSGQLKKHYSPKKPLLIGNINELIESNQNKKIAVITFGMKNSDYGKNRVVFNLSPSGDLKEAAANLFETLYHADLSDTDVIITEYLPDKGLGIAINDRFKRSGNIQ